MEKISLVMTSLNPIEFKINRALQSAKGFDNIYLHIDAGTKKIPHIDLTKILPPVIIVDSKTSMCVDEAYNLIIKDIPDNSWICCFCDDDFFDEKGLANIIASIHAGNHLGDDIIHFKVHVSGNKPYHQWGAAGIGKLEENNVIPAGSFFRKSVWTKCGGFRGDIWHDWVLWLRAAKAGCKFRFYDESVYWFMMRDQSAADRQLKKFDGSFEKARERVLQDASA